jgi:hypothetical protein
MNPFDSGKECVNVVIETPKGSRVKYAYNLKKGMFEREEFKVLGKGGERKALDRVRKFEKR